MKQVYFDQAATSFPKAPGVGEAMASYLTTNGANVNRGTYQQASLAALTVLETRELLAKLFHFTQGAEYVVFTPGCTWGMNMIIQGLLQAGDHVIVSSMEHNAVMRPLVAMEKQGVSFSRLPASLTGETCAADMLPLIKENTKAVIVSHASNVSGTILPLAAIAKICQEHHLPLIVDGAQSAGHLDINFAELGLAALVVPGHKGLLGPQGIGALVLDKEFAAKLKPVITGGTGSASDSEVQPNYMPDKFESGTMNLPGIFGLHKALEFILNTGLATLHTKQTKLLAYFLQQLTELSVHVAGPCDAAKQVGVISLDFTNIDNATAAFHLEQDYGLMTRCGLHCAPHAHKTLGTFPQGTVRFSLGNFTTLEEIDYAVDAIKAISLL